MKQIPLTQDLYALVDDEDCERVAQYSWWATQVKNRYYAMRHIRPAKGIYRKELLHRFILQAPPGVQVDHINGDSLDCQRSNLRFANNAENQQNRGKHADNTSGYKGVSSHQLTKRWRARIRANNRDIHLGFFDTPEDAAHAYDAAALRYHGEFARTNFMVETHAVGEDF